MFFDLVIFDLDGTLIDTRFDLTTAVNEMLSSYGLPLKSVDEVTGMVGDGIRVLVERSLDTMDADIDEAIKRFWGSYRTHLLDRSRPYPGVEELLTSLGSRKKAVLTNKSYEFTRALTDGLGLTGRFQCIVGPDSTVRMKPHTDGLCRILHETDTPANRAIMVGDGRNDILVARKAGLASVWASYGFCGREKLGGEKPDFEIARPLRLLDILESRR